MKWNEGSVGQFTMPSPPIDVELVYVYVAYGTDPRPLYVGMSRYPLARLGDHAKQSRWFPSAKRFDLFAFVTADEALEAEDMAIAELNPIYNVMGNIRPLAGEPEIEYVGRRVRPHRQWNHGPEIQALEEISPDQLAIIARVQNRGRAA